MCCSRACFPLRASRRSRPAIGCIAKGLDKLETILQHNQGAMPDDFDFRFNLEYGAKYTTDDPVLRTIRALLDAETEHRARERESRNVRPAT